MYRNCRGDEAIGDVVGIAFGAVENVNRIVRRWFPKGTDFSKVPRKEILALESIINSIHRKSLNVKPLELLTIEDAAQVLKPHDGKPFVDDIRFFDGRHDIRAIWPYRIESAVRAIAAVEYKDKRRNSGGEIPGANASAHDYCEAAPAVAVLRRRDGRIRLEHRLGHVVVEHHPAVLDARTEVSHEDAVLHYLHIVASHFGI